MLTGKPVCRVGLKGGPVNKRLYLYYLSLKPYWGKPNVRNFRGGTGNIEAARVSAQTLNRHCG
jgi:hypothetical protein